MADDQSQDLHDEVERYGAANRPSLPSFAKFLHQHGKTTLAQAVILMHVRDRMLSHISQLALLGAAISGGALLGPDYASLIVYVLIAVAIALGAFRWLVMRTFRWHVRKHVRTIQDELRTEIPSHPINPRNN